LRQSLTLILELPDNKEAALKAKAQAQGVSAEQYAETVLNRDLEEPASSAAAAPAGTSTSRSRSARKPSIATQ